MKRALYEVMQYCDFISEEDITKGITSNYIKDWVWILHDKDKYTKEDEEKNKEHKENTLKKAHYHVYIRCKESTDSKYIAAAFNVPEQYVQAVKGKWVDVLLYATHKNKQEKYQYSDEEVHSNFNFAEVRDREEEKKKSNLKLEDIIQKIECGELREFNYTEYISMADYVKFERQLTRAFKYRTDKLKGVDRKMDCIYIVGESGCGKTTYAKKIAKEQGMSFYVSSGSNDVLDDYKGQDCIILDDLRPSCLGLSDLLKMLDNNTASTVKSRFKNKVLECKLIIITTTLDISTFFRNVFAEEKESAIQLYRRCGTMIKMNINDMDVFSFNNKKRMYEYLYTVENPIDFVDREQTREELDAYVSNLLGIKKEQKKTKLEPLPKEYEQLDLFDIMK
jgi:cytidylate kinase